MPMRSTDQRSKQIVANSQLLKSVILVVVLIYVGGGFVGKEHEMKRMDSTAHRVL